MADPVAQAVVAASDDPAYRNGLRPVPADQATPAPASATSAAPAPDHEELRRQIDALSLSQALLDFEVALGGLASAIRIDAIRAIPIAPLLDEYAAPLVETLFPRDRPHVAGPEAAAPSESPRGTAP